MVSMLPADLRTAETQARDALLAALATTAQRRWSVEWRFEGLRILPLALRFSRALHQEGRAVHLLFPDAGACALAKRDAPDLGDRMADFRSLLNRALEPSEASDEALSGLLVAVAPAAPDYDMFAQICSHWAGSVVMLNGSLEDAAVGIGSVARQRRRGFMAEWQVAYALRPLEGSALRRAFPGEWELYRQDPDGYRLVASFDQPPDAEAQAQALAGDDGLRLGANLKAVDAFIEGLSR
jgi:predicted nuclease with RNAse H fold